MDDVDALADDGQQDDAPQRRWGWKTVAGCLVLGFIVLRVGWLILPGNGRGGIEIGPETTVITEPQLPDGFVDFSAAINARAGDGVTPENNAVVLLVQAFGPGEIQPEVRSRYFELLGIPPLPHAGEYLVDESGLLRARGIPESELARRSRELAEELGIAVTRPWTDEEFPDLAALLAANGKPLELIFQATERRRYYSPIPVEDAEVMYVLLPIEQQSRWGARLLTLRGMRRLSDGDAEGAWSDILACHRLARLAGQSPHTIGVFVSYAIDKMACAAGHALIGSDALTAEQARRCMADLDALPRIAVAADKVEFGERLSAVDAYCRIAAGTSSSLEDTNVPEIRTLGLGRLFDWNVMLRLLNQHIDRTIEIMRLPDASERQQEFNKLNQELQSRPVMTWQGVVTGVMGLRGTISRDVNGVLMGLLSAPLEQFRNAEMGTEAALHVTRLGFALAAYEREHGTYPATLDELAPGIIAEIPVDPCCGTAFVYRPTEGGFVLYSVGTNLTDDGGRGYDDEPRGDDIVLRVERD